MAEKVVRYERKSVKAVRGMEARSVAKWEKQGWELVNQEPATLHTLLHFRKVKPPLPVRQLVIVGALLAVGLVGLGVRAGLEGGGKDDEVATARATPRVEATATPSLEESAVEATPTAESTPTAEPTTTAPSPAQVPERPITDTTVDALLDRLNAGSSGGIKVGDRFRFSGELFQKDLWGVGVTGEYSVYLNAKGGQDDLRVFVDPALATDWSDGTQVEMVVRAEERMIDGETSDGWINVQSAKAL